MNIGFFNTQTDGSLFGHLPSMNLQNVSFEPVQATGKAPNYRASIEGAELGAAWKRTSAGGKDYVSAKIVIPGLAPVWLALFATQEAGKFVAVYDEPKPDATKA